MLLKTSKGTNYDLHFSCRNGVYGTIEAVQNALYAVTRLHPRRLSNSPGKDILTSMEDDLIDMVNLPKIMLPLPRKGDPEHSGPKAFTVSLFP
jgi:hypothetical protein